MKCKFPYNPNVIASIKEYPGVHWDKRKSVWFAPKELANGWLEEVATRHGLEYRDVELKRNETAKQNLAHYTYLDSRLYPYQQESIKRALNEGGLLLAYEMGLGKSVAAIATAKTIDAKRILVVCPKAKILEWQQDFKTWFGRVNFCIVEKGLDWADVDAPIDRIPSLAYVVVCTHDLVEDMNGCEVHPFGVIIIDESHKVKNPHSLRGKAAKRLCSVHSPHSLKILLTGTPMDNEPKDIWHQLDLVWPNRVGSNFRFTRRYCNVQYNGFADIVAGLTENPLQQAELKTRLESMVHRVTIEEASAYLPKIRVETAYVEPVVQPKWRELDERWQSSELKAHEQKIIQSTVQAALAKTSTVVQDVVEAKETTKRIVILTYHRVVAKRIFDDLIASKIWPKPIYIDGETTRRVELLDKIQGLDEYIIVGTMKSIGEGTNALRHTQLALFAELYYKTAVITQAIGRFRRIGGTVNALVKFYVLKNSTDELIQDVLVHRITDINKVLKAGANEDDLEKGLGVGELDDETFKQRMLAVAESQIDLDNYL